MIRQREQPEQGWKAQTGPGSRSQPHRAGPFHQGGATGEGSVRSSVGHRVAGVSVQARGKGAWAKAEEGFTVYKPHLSPLPPSLLPGWTEELP
jgi:hypothetical protein